MALIDLNLRLLLCVRLKLELKVGFREEFCSRAHSCFDLVCIDIFLDHFDLLFDSKHVAFSSESTEVSACEVRRQHRSNLIKVDIIRKLHSARLSLHDLDFLLDGLCDTQVNHLVKSAGSQQCRVQQIRTVSRTDCKHARPLAEPVDFSQQLGNDAVHHLARIRTFAASGCQRIKLVKEYDARQILSCSFKDLSDILFRLANVHIEQLRALDRNEVHLTLSCDRFGKQCLPCTWRAIKQKARTLGDAVFEQVRLLNWQHDSLQNVLLGISKPAHVGPFYFWNSNRILAE